jgi:hypothetical protein
MATPTPSRKRKSDTGCEYARQHAAEDKMSQYYQDVLAYMAANRKPVIERLIVQNPDSSAVHVFADDPTPKLNEAIKARRTHVTETHPAVKKDALVGLLRADHVIIAVVAPLAAGGRKTYWDGVSVAADAAEAATSIHHWRPYPRHFLSSIAIEEAKDGKNLAALIQRDSATPDGEYTFTLPGGLQMPSPNAWDAHYLLDKYVKTKTPPAPPPPPPVAVEAEEEEEEEEEEAVPRAKAPAADADADATGVVVVTDPLAAMGADPETPAFVQASKLEDVGPGPQLRIYTSPIGFTGDEILEARKTKFDPDQVLETWYDVVTFLFMLKETMAAELMHEEFHRRTGLAINTQTADVAVEQHRADVEITRAHNVRVGTQFFLADHHLVAERYRRGLSDEEYPAHHLIRVILASTKVPVLRRCADPDAIGRRCAFTGLPIESEDVIKLVAYVPGPVPGVLDNASGGYVTVYCRPTYTVKDVRTKSLRTIEAAEKAAAEAAVRAAAAQAAQEAQMKAKDAKEARALKSAKGAKKRKVAIIEEEPPAPTCEDEEDEEDAMDIDGPPQAEKIDDYVSPPEWQVEETYKFSVTPTLRNLIEAAGETEPTRADEELRKLLATEPSNKAMKMATHAFDTALNDIDSTNVLVTALDQFIQVCQPDEDAPLIRALYAAGRAPEVDALQGLAYFLRFASKIPASFREKKRVKANGAFSPIHYALARVLFCGLEI